MLGSFPLEMTELADVEAYPLVSVIINNYNYGRFLKQAIDSVLAQTYNNIELIVVDDGSTDHSRDVIQAYSDRLIPILQENRGVGKACSAGFLKSRGDIICFLDADDYFHPEKIAKVVAAFQQHPEWIQISHLWTTVDKEGIPSGRSTSNVLSSGDVRSFLLKWGKYASGISSALAYRRSTLEKVLPLNGDMGIDSYFNATLPFYGSVGCINEPLMFYRIHGKNIRAHSDNLDRLIKQREAIANFINTTARKFGLTQHFNIHRDADYRVYVAIQQGKSSPLEVLQIMALSIYESIDIGRGGRDTLIRFLTRSICALFPHEGLLVLRYGLRRYVRYRVFGRAVEE